MCKQGRTLVAYDLGLGKTVITIAAIEQLKKSGKVKLPGLVICLSSLKYQWASQIDKFTSGSSKALVIDGAPLARIKQYASAKDYDYIVVNYEQVVNDFDLIKKLKLDFIVADEATAIKSFKSKRSKSVKKLKTKFAFALTGTPVENGKAEELFSIMEFVDKEVFGSFGSFDNRYIVRNYFGWIEKYKNLDSLHARLSTASVRKRQSDPDVSPYLPRTIHAAPILVRMDPSMKKLYNMICDELLEDLSEVVINFPTLRLFGDGSYDPEANEIRGRIMSKLTVLRLLCDHPELVLKSGVANNFDPLGIEGSKYAGELVSAGLLDPLKKAPKLAVLKEIVLDFLSQDVNNKVVIFTGFVNMVDIIASEFKEFNAQKFTGQLNAKEKENAKVTFQTDPNTRILVSSDAGGYGVDLPQANFLINYDLPWNAGLATQRNGRIQRASSEWEHVVIQDILMQGSIEQRQYDMLQQKMSVANAIVDGEGITSEGDLDLTMGSLKQFLQNV
jgi:SNF2 family DNA or RNA helicase